VADAARHPAGHEGLAKRIGGSWRGLDRDQRIAAVAAIALLVSLLLPWYQQTGFTSGRAVSQNVTGFGAFTYVEASILLVCCAVLWMLFIRGESRPFHLPGGDGAIIAIGGGWIMTLLIWRLVFDQPTQPGLETGIEWGLGVAFIAAGVLLGAGLRIHQDRIPEPPMPTETHEFAAMRTPRMPRSKASSRPKAKPRDQDPTVEQLTIPLEETDPDRD
jgi:hypothetical protein